MKKKCNNCFIGLRCPSYEIEDVYYNDLDFNFPDTIFNFCPYCGHRILTYDYRQIKIL